MISSWNSATWVDLMAINAGTADTRFDSGSLRITRADTNQYGSAFMGEKVRSMRKKNSSKPHTTHARIHKCTHTHIHLERKEQKNERAYLETPKPMTYTQTNNHQ